MKEEYKITFIIPSIEMGGAETMTIEMVNELAKRNIPTQLIVLSDKDDLIDTINQEVYINVLNLKHFDTLNKKSFIYSYFKKKLLRKVINGFKPTHVISCMPMAHLITRLATTKQEIYKHYIYHHSTEYAINPINSISQKILFKAQLAASTTDYKHIYISTAVKNDIEKVFKPAEGFVLYNAIRGREVVDNDCSSLVNNLKLSKEEYLILPGRLHPVKGHVFFLKAVSEIIKQYDLIVVFAGGGGERGNIEKLLKDKGLEKHVKITGSIENHIMLCLINQAKLVIIPSLEEGLGNVAIESLMLGKTILSSNAGGLPEVVQDKKTGFIFEKNNQNELKKRLIEILLNFHTMKLDPKNLKQAFTNKFTIEAQINRLLKFLRDDDNSF